MRISAAAERFQSTLPVWGATSPHFEEAARKRVNFNPRSPCGERPIQPHNSGRILRISIHAPRVGSDANGASVAARRLISIHAPRVGSDSVRVTGVSPDSKFQSTLPVWGATIHGYSFLIAGKISIHAPRVGSDILALADIPKREKYFNPRSPCGERHIPRGMIGESVCLPISTLPVWGATTIMLRRSIDLKKFQSTLPVWGATTVGMSYGMEHTFQSTLPVWGATSPAPSP